jgi:hypothetical protein
VAKRINRNPLKKLQQYFSIKVKNLDKQNKVVAPAKYKKDGSVRTIKFPSEFEKFMQYWYNQCHDNNTTLSDRFGRYRDMDWMEKEEPIISTALDMYGNESTQADGQGYILTVKANKDVAKYINKKIIDWGFTQNKLREMCYNVAKYGDCFWINVFEEGEGITETILLDPREIQDVLEFDPKKVKKQFTNDRLYVTMKKNRMQSLIQIADTISKGLDNASDYYKRYLMGYAGDGDIYFAPYQVSHARMYTAKTEFYPYGRSLLINTISPYRQFKTAKDLMVMARASNFPKEVYNITVDEEMSEMDMWEAVNEVRENLKKLGSSPQTTDTNMSIGGVIWTIDGLVSYDLKENRMDLGNIADIENLEEEIIRPTGIPLDYIKQSSGWNNNSNLLSQSKIFARKIYSVQSPILEEIISMIKMDFIVSGKFDVDTDFELSMNFPITESDRDKAGLMNDQLRMAKDIIDNIGASLGLDRDEALPQDIVRDIFAKYSFLSDTDIKKWLDIYNKTKTSEDENTENENNRMFNSVRKKLSRLNETVIWRSYFKSKKDNGMYEGLSNRKHFKTSENVSFDNDFKLMLLNVEYGKNNSRLTEKFNRLTKNYLKD